MKKPNKTVSIERLKKASRARLAFFALQAGGPQGMSEAAIFSPFAKPGRTYLRRQLKATDGRARRLLFLFFPDGEDAMGIGSQALSKKK